MKREVRRGTPARRFGKDDLLDSGKGGLKGAIAALVVYGLSQFVDLSPEVQAAVVTLVFVGVEALAKYLFKTERTEVVDAS